MSTEKKGRGRPTTRSNEAMMLALWTLVQEEIHLRGARSEREACRRVYSEKASSECGHQVSDKAASCPKCGAPIAALSSTNPSGSNASTSTVEVSDKGASPIKIFLILVVGAVIFRFFTDLSGGKLAKRVDSRKLQNVHSMLRYARVIMSSLVIVNSVQVFLVVATIACALLLRRSNRKLHEQLQAARQQSLQD